MRAARAGTPRAPRRTPRGGVQRCIGDLGCRAAAARRRTATGSRRPAGRSTSARGSAAAGCGARSGRIAISRSTPGTAIARRGKRNAIPSPVTHSALSQPAANGARPSSDTSGNCPPMRARTRRLVEVDLGGPLGTRRATAPLAAAAEHGLGARDRRGPEAAGRGHGPSLPIRLGGRALDGRGALRPETAKCPKEPLPRFRSSRCKQLPVRSQCYCPFGHTESYRVEGRRHNAVIHENADFGSPAAEVVHS